MMKDHGTGWSGNCFDLVQTLNGGANFADVLQLIANDFGLRKIKNPLTPTQQKAIITAIPKAKESSKIIIQPMYFESADILYWASHGIREYVLKVFDVTKVRHVWLNNAIYYTNNNYSPCYAYVFDSVHVKCYFPLRKDNRFLGNSNSIQGLDKLPKSGDLLVITKSYKDVMFLFDQSISAIAPQSETASIPEDIYEDLSKRFGEIVLLYDDDEAGVKGADKIQREYGLPIIYLGDEYGGKDITDVYKNKGDIDGALNKIRNAGRSI